MIKKVVPMFMAVIALIVFSLPFISTSQGSIDGFTMTFGYSTLDYSITGFNIILFATILLTMGGIVLTFTRFDKFCPLVNFLCVVLMLAYAFTSVETIAEEILAYLPAGGVGIGIGALLAMALYAGAVVFRLMYKPKAIRNQKRLNKAQADALDSLKSGELTKREP